ncbi:twin-arginine translocase subunit TatC [Paenibacillus terrae]|uniref:Sec-independent protein translocase protein TatC n=1 Tax=Paenibacillus terrae TaxID=159743 RepID=A0A0D7WXB9_9BACL|nr:twin-arginine translocase subunit TatC [Paenibacillus terrae]KJD43831.1 preprotein translocase subunit TatC [Paenibacillus terrae]
MTPPEHEMPLMEHLGELRRRIIYVLIVFVLALAGGLFAAGPVYDWLIRSGSAQAFQLNAFSFWDGIGIYMKIAMLIGIAVALPFACYQLWKFVSPGLRPQERNATLRYVPYVLLLFVIGAAFAYFIVFPMAIQFTSSVTKSMGLHETYGIAQYFTFMFNIVLPVALLFELPLLIMFLTGIRVLTPMRLRKWRKISYFLLVFVAVVITPPDFISDFLVAIPLLVLYEVSVYMSVVVYRKQLRADEEREAQLRVAPDR